MFVVAGADGFSPRNTSLPKPSVQTYLWELSNNDLVKQLSDPEDGHRSQWMPVDPERDVTGGETRIPIEDRNDTDADQHAEASGSPGVF